ncbi:MAG: TraR/DksA C4-type zinc finger protein [bacterium]
MQYPKNLLTPILVALKKLETDLLSRRAKLKAEDPFADISRLDDNADDGTEAAEQFGHDQSEAMNSQTTSMLSRVRGAMTRIEAGSYGQCVKCGNMIDTDRLGIDPTAELCIACAKKQK